MQHREYTVVKGDTLGSIAKRELGKGSMWSKLYEMNRDTISEEQARRGCDRKMRGPNWIFPGTTLRIYG